MDKATWAGVARIGQGFVSNATGTASPGRLRFSQAFPFDGGDGDGGQDAHTDELLRPFSCTCVSKGDMKSNKLVNEVHEIVRETYDKVATGRQKGCCGADGPTPTPAGALGCRPEGTSGLPEAADLGLGCGNPQAIAVKPAGSCCGPECCQ